MKKNLPLFLKIATIIIGIITCFSVSKVSAQSGDYKKNNIRVNLSSLVLHNYSFNYERSVARKITISAGYKFMPDTRIGDVSLINTISDKISHDGDNIDYKNTRTSNQTFTAEARFYTGKHDGPRGFYVSVYGRYNSMKVDYPYVYNDGNGNKVNVPLNTTLNGIGGGVMIGAKWLIAQKVSLDVYILGLHYGSMSGDVIGNTDLSGLSASDKQGLKDDIDSKFVLLNHNYVKSSSVTNSGVTAHASGPFAGIRGLGINLGFSF
ncbi:DUF3575 domain-containing protein [Mucilaginibacter ginsenosidivorax]|nr:DUF3575 domain-containing protein [Mucilaginibacter ginsenosidivorax]